jgi:hypothetical protein
MALPAKNQAGWPEGFISVTSLVAQLIQTWCLVNQSIPKIISNVGDSMDTRDVGKITPLIDISNPQHTIFVLSLDPGDCTTITLSKRV